MLLSRVLLLASTLSSIRLFSTKSILISIIFIKTSKYLNMAKLIACVGDSSDHGGTIITSNQDGTLVIGSSGGSTGESGGDNQFGTITYGSPGEGGGGISGAVVAVNGAQHSCPIPLHGITDITAITTKSYHNGRLILTINAVAGCGAKITPPSNRKIYIE